MLFDYEDFEADLELVKIMEYIPGKFLENYEYLINIPYDLQSELCAFGFVSDEAYIRIYNENILKGVGLRGC